MGLYKNTDFMPYLLGMARDIEVTHNFENLGHALLNCQPQKSSNLQLFLWVVANQAMHISVCGHSHQNVNYHDFG